MQPKRLRIGGTMIKIQADHRNKNILIKIKKNPNHFRTGIRKALIETGREMDVLARQEISDKSKKSGRIYLLRLGKRTVKHQASAPGEYPAKITGTLKRSVYPLVVGSSKLLFGYLKDAFYGKFLEDGTKKMGARPALKMTILSKQRDLLGALKRHIARTL